MGGSPSMQAPPAPDPGKEFTSALNAYAQGAPQLYQTESQYQPMYNQLQQQMQQANIASYAQQYTSMLPGMQQSADQLQSQASPRFVATLAVLSRSAWGGSGSVFKWFTRFNGRPDC